MSALIDLDDGTARILAAIRQAGGRPMLVGGCVRDALMAPGTPAKDIDIEVYGLPFGVLSDALADTEKVTEAGKSFGVLKVRAGSTELDISVPRRESKTGAGHRGFDVAADPEMTFAEASSRRDFTINSLMYDPATGRMVSHHGGAADLRNGVLRHTSAAFSEDPLRVLRGVQFAARFGFSMAPETATLCRSLIDSYAELATERVWGEWEKIGTRGTDITAALDVLAATGWDVWFHPLGALRGLEQDPEWHPEGDVWTHSGLAATQAARLADDAGLTGTDRFVIVMAALLHDVGKVTHTQRCGGRITSHGHAAAGAAPANVLLCGLGCPPAIRDRILPLIGEHMSCQGKPTKPAVRRLARRLVPASLAELALVIGGDRKGRGDPDADNPAAAWLEKAKDLTVAERPAKGLLTGDHLIAAGMTPGPLFRPLLAAALSAQDNGQFDSEAGAVAWVAGRAGTVLLSGVVGSVAYGLDHEESDVDRLGMYAARTAAFHGLRTLTVNDLTWSSDSKPDVTYHEALKLVSLCLACNPTATELLWLPEYETLRPLGAELVGMRDSLLSAGGVCNAYIRYAVQQFRRLENRGDGSFSSDTRKRTAKHARHLWRLVHQGLDLNATGTLTVRLDADQAQACREFGEQVAAGDLDVGRRLIGSAEAQFGTQRSALPAEPDTAAAEAWLQRVRAELYSPAGS